MRLDEIAKCIPDEVVQVIRKACDSGEPWNIRDTFAAALAAWKAAEKTELCGGRSGPALILPLSQEGAADLNEGDDELLWRRD
jgi:hypothetical protein